nr:nucleotidyltransferase family protein [Solitalea agri]
MLNELALDSILFVVDDNDRLIGSLTDGDIRRGLIKELTLENQLIDFIQPHPVFIENGNYTIEDLHKFKERSLKIIPILNESHQVIEILNFRLQKSLLPLTALIMAGGEGVRLRPLTENTPKPMLKVGDKPIIEYNIDRLKLFGIRNIFISIKYLGEQLIDYFGDGSQKGINIQYIKEDEPLGTIGAISLLKGIAHDNLLVMNSDILTNIDYEDFYSSHRNNCSTMSVSSVPYNVKIPYAVLETNDHSVVSFVEKPTYTFYSNGGIYLINKEILSWVPKNQIFHATDLMQEVIKRGAKLTNYPLLDYWLDIGRHEDYIKAQEDIKHIKF